MATTTSDAKKTTEMRGGVLDVVRDLLASQKTESALNVVAKLVARNAELEKLVASLRAAKGKKNERVAREQLDLFLAKLKEQSAEALATANADLEKAANENGGREERPKPPKQPPVRKPAPRNLPRVENPIAVPAEERPCPSCGAARVCIFHETTEVIDFEPAKVYVRRDTREIIACKKCDAEVMRAPMGDKVVPGGAYGASLVAKLVVGKFDLGLPLHRQGEELQRLGLDMPSSSMSDQIMWATELLRPLWKLLIADVLNALVMHIDSTGLPVLDRDHPNGITVGSLWGIVGDKNVAAYLYTSTGKQHAQREGEIGPVELLARRRGFVCADAANLFDSSFVRADIIELGCNMHGRRYFKKALDAGDARAAVPIAAFRAIYDVEEDARDADADRRRDERQRRSKPVYDELVEWCRTYKSPEPPTSLLAKAINYLLNHEAELTRFLDDGRLPIDNGIVERLHRRPAIGRRNYLFAGSHAAGERAAIAYSVLGTCRLLDIDPSKYLADVLPKLARESLRNADRRDLMPAPWHASRAK